MHMLNMVRAIGEKHLAVTEIAAEHTDLLSGAESRRKETVGVEALEPLAVEPIGFGPTGGALGLAGIDQEYLQAPGLQELKQGNPVDPGRFHRDGGHATLNEPVGQGVKVSGEGAERRTGCGSRPGGTATQCSASPMSMPAAWGWQTWRASESRGERGSRGVGADGRGSRPESLWGVMAASGS